MRPVSVTLWCCTAPAGSLACFVVGDVAPHVATPGVATLVHHDTTAVAPVTFERYGPRVIISVPAAGVDAERPAVAVEML